MNPGDGEADTLSQPVKHAGYVAIIGRPNVGKSTLLNHLVQQKISITSRKPQTTRHNLLGIKTVGNTQMLFIDTPGLHTGQDKAINRYMNRVAMTATRDVDVIIWVLDKLAWKNEDDMILQRLSEQNTPVIVALNKVDQVADKNQLLPQMDHVSSKLPGSDIIPISALQGQNLSALEEKILTYLPEAEHYYPDDQVTDRNSRFMAAELIREKIVRQLGAELPYQTAVAIEEFRQDGQILHISGLILVERAGQKKILIGDKGSRIKSIGQLARLDMETLFQSQVMLNLWVKVKSGWSDDDRALRSLGYD